MSQQINSLVRLEQAFSETHNALGKLLQIIREESLPNIAKDKETRRQNSYDKIIPAFVLEAYREQRQLGEQLDECYKRLLLEERELLLAYLDPKNAQHHDSLLARLETVQQEMMEILWQFDLSDTEA